MSIFYQAGNNNNDEDEIVIAGYSIAAIIIIASSFFSISLYAPAPFKILKAIDKHILHSSL
jgi:hypothetical protein